MSISQEDILNAVGEMSVLQVVELIKAFEEKFGVTAAAASAGPAAAAEDPSTVPEVRLGHCRCGRSRLGADARSN